MVVPIVLNDRDTDDVVFLCEDCDGSRTANKGNNSTG